MNILHLLPTLERRGAQMFAVDLCRELRHYGVTQSLAVLAGGPDEVGFSELEIPTVRLCGPGRCGGRGSLRACMEDSGAEIVFAHGGDPFKRAVLARGRRRAPKIVYRKIGLSAPWLGRPRLPRLLFQRWLVRHADAIVVLGEVLRQELVTLLHAGSGAIRTIRQGVPAARCAIDQGGRAKARERLAVPPGTTVLLSLGALGWEKHQEAMLGALAAVRAQAPQALLLLAGDGPERGRLERLAADLGIADTVRFLGTRTDVRDLLAASDAILLTSLTEGVPGALIEAGVAGVPAVAWDVAGVREVVQDGVTGLVPPYRDEQSFAAAILRLLGDPAGARGMGMAARDFCRERFSMDRCVEQHVELFRELLGGKA